MLGYVIQIATSLFAASPSTLTLKVANSAIPRASLDVSCLLRTGDGRDSLFGILYCALLLLCICVQQGVWSVLQHLGPKNSMEVPNIINIFLYV